MPLISVIPAYNAEHTILKIQSVQDKLSNFELIVINDGSTDRTLEILSVDTRLKIFSYENGGLPVARNVVLSMLLENLLHLLMQMTCGHQIS